MLSYLHRFVIPAAYDLLPRRMESPAATAMLLAIALQESECAHRRQQPLGPGKPYGPARGFWQFEAGGGVRGVLTHPATQHTARVALVSLCYPKSMTVPAIHAAIEHNDVLAAVWARLNLFWLSAPLPGRGDADDGWRQYVEAWRPGKPHPETWPANFARAWALIEPEGGA